MSLFLPPTSPDLASFVRKTATAVNNLLRRVGAFGTSASHSGDATVSDADYLLLMDATSAALNVYLPSSQARQIVVKKVDSSPNAITIHANGSELIDGSATIVVNTQWQTRVLIGIAGGWAVL